MTPADDQKYMRKVFVLARKGSGFVSPNPLVGALLVKNGHIIGRGFHHRFGEAHAEIDAFDNARTDLSGATLYVNLEPCSHTSKKTPPCVPRIIQEGIKRVVISTIDPNPLENGRGVSILRQAGIEVVTGVLENEGAELNKFFFKYILKGIPYVTVKVAQTLNGYITESANKQTWISGEQSQRYVHRLRAEHDAVLIGAQTVRVDDPQLTVRKFRGRNPHRIILDGQLSLTPDFRVFTDDPDAVCHLFTANNGTGDTEPFERRGILIHKLAMSTNSGIGIPAILNKLSTLGISSVLVEGGNDVFSQFIGGGFWDELKIFVAPKIWNTGVSLLLPSTNIKINNLILFGVKRMENDVLFTFKSKDR
jgi:diaminohydroxyphosphoribosylaminopyrimidine deaminase/5-amino-6-(5-phosphoribosylamino)uracil reductase